MVLENLLGRFSRRNAPPQNKDERKVLKDFDLEAVYFQITSAIIAHKDLASILDLVVQESLKALRAHRATIFFMDEITGIPRAQFIKVSHLRYQEEGLSEERVVAKNSIRQAKSFFLEEQKDFLQSFKNKEGRCKLSSLLSIPLSSQGKCVGVLIVVLINEKRKFSARDLKYLFFFGNMASLAIENIRLQEELLRETNTRKIFERYLDDIIFRVQRLFEKENQPREKPLENLLPAGTADGYQPPENQPSKKATRLNESRSSSNRIGVNYPYSVQPEAGLQT